MSDVAAPIAVFAEVVAQPGRREDVLAAARQAFAAALEEPGTAVYSIHVCEDEPDTVRFYEVYDDAEARAAHSGSEAIATLVGALGELLAQPPRIVVTTPVMAKGHAADRRG
jgi:quinol monooxygenase YgiN